MAGLEGTNVGPYEMKALLGAGGMGQVYRARDPRLERDVAIKVLTEALSREPGYLERFRREARSVAKLDHPNIVPVYDFGEQGDLLYLVMPLILGGTLRDYLAHRRVLPLAETVSIIEQVAGALQYAHERGLIHRDVKPANILMSAEGRILLTDFGIVRVVEKQDADPSLTRAGAFVGSPEYAAPEMVVGAPVDHRVDVYALGVVLFQMLTGQLPFAAPTAVAVLMMQAQQPPPPPRSLNADVSPAVEAVMLKALAKQPAERYQTTAQFAAALRAAVVSPAMGAIADLPTVLTSGPPAVPGSGPYSPMVPGSGPSVYSPAMPGSGPSVYSPAGLGSGPPPVWIGPGSGPAGSPVPGSGPAGWPTPGSGPSGWTALGSGPSGWANPGSGPSVAPPMPPTFATGLSVPPGQPPSGETTLPPPPARRRLTLVLLAVLALVLVVGGGATLALANPLGLFKGTSTPLAQTSPTATATTRPSPTPTATPTAYYMAHHFVTMNGDLENGDTVSNPISISSGTYDAREGANGNLYQNGTADMFGWASGIVQVVSDQNGNAIFVVVVDRIDTYQDAQQYFQRQVGLIQGPASTQKAGEEAEAGIVMVKSQQTYQLFVRDVNIMITVATLPANTAPNNFGDYFVRIVQDIIPRGQACTYSTDGKITLLAGNDPNACK